MPYINIEGFLNTDGTGVHQPSSRVAWNQLWGNLVSSGFSVSADAPFNFDDGSDMMNVSSNVLLYGGFLAGWHSRDLRYLNNLVVRPDFLHAGGACLACPSGNWFRGWNHNESALGNECITAGALVDGAGCDSSDLAGTTVLTSNNRYFNLAGNDTVFSCGTAKLSLAGYQALFEEKGLDGGEKGSSVHPMPSVHTSLAMARVRLGLQSAADTASMKSDDDGRQSGGNRAGIASLTPMKLDDDDDHTDPWPGPCPCSNPKWCKPLKPQPPPRPEVVAYHGTTSNTNKTGLRANSPWSAAGMPPFNNGSMWRSYDWTKVTTIGLFAALEGPEGWDLLCTAHQHKVRVLPWAGAVWGRSSRIAEPYITERGAEEGEGGHTKGEASGIFNDKAKLTRIAKDSVEFVAAAGLDGILLDAESLRNATIRDGMTFWVSQLRVELDAALPGALLTWTTSPDASSWYNETWQHPQKDYALNVAYDYAAIAPHIDFFQPMLYCNSGAQPMPHEGPYRFVYGSRSNSPIWEIKKSMDSYTALGIPKSKIVMLLALFGSDFICATANCSTVIWSKTTNGGCGQALDGGPGFGQALALLNNATALGRSVDVSPMWDEGTATPYFRWRNSSDGKLHELWYEDSHSFGKKCAEAKRVGARGVGIWLPENAANFQQAASMWAVIPSFGTDAVIKSDDAEVTTLSKVNKKIALYYSGWQLVGQREDQPTV
jgi:spore germination protein YaaH